MSRPIVWCYVEAFEVKTKQYILEIRVPEVSTKTFILFLTAFSTNNIPQISANVLYLAKIAFFSFAYNDTSVIYQ